VHKKRQEDTTMNDYMIEDIYLSQDIEPSWFEIQEGQLPPVAWEELHSRLRWAMRVEQIWEWGFVFVTFSLMGWYMYWFFTALQNFTIIPWP
jgi:hypothetical protein